MRFRIYVDESGTHSNEWLIIGMLFVPDHGTLHPALCDVKEKHEYFNASPKHAGKYKETHFQKFRSPRDITVGKEWIDLFTHHSCYYRCVVIDWSIWDGKYFGDPFTSEALKKRRAYKKWAEILLHRELKCPLGGRPIYHAKMYLDRLRLLQGYDVVAELEDRFTRNYEGESPYIDSFQDTDSKHDANQCLQLCDLLTGCLYQALVPSVKLAKRDMCAYLGKSLEPYGVKSLSPSFWRGYAANSLTKHFQKYSAWFWQPTEEGKKKWKKRRR